MIETLAQVALNAVVLGVTYTLIALGLTLIYSMMRIINFAHGQLFMLGAYAFYVIFAQIGIAFLPALLFSGLIVAAVGFLLEKSLFRRLRGKELSSLLLSLGIGLFLEAGILLLFGEKDKGVMSPFSGAFNVSGIFIGKERVALLLISLLIFCGLFLFLKFTRTGRAIRAFSQDTDAAMLQGIDIDRISSMGFALGSGLAALAGALLAPVYWVNPFIGGPAVVNAFIVMVIGGLGSIPGTILGGLILGAIESFGKEYLPGSWNEAIAYSLVVIVLIIRPKGLMGYED